MKPEYIELKDIGDDDEGPSVQIPLEDDTDMKIDIETATGEAPRRIVELGVTVELLILIEGHQTLRSFITQVFPSILVAGLGMLCAGILLDTVQHWPLFLEISEMFILVPALLGLKGNLEMTLASRLSTAANLGELATFDTCRPLLVANLMLVQVQAILVGLSAALLSIVMGVVLHHEFSIMHSLLLIAASITTASIASALLGILMGVIVFYSQRFNINPDNVATPIAAALGDLVTLSLFSGIGSFLYMCITFAPSVAPLITIVFLFGVLPVCYSRVRDHKSSFKTLRTLFTHQHAFIKSFILQRWPWLAVGIAMCISSTAGVILERNVSAFEGLAVLAPIMNGIGGNLGAVLASRVSTALHAASRQPHRTAMIALFLLVPPTSVIFLLIIRFLGAGHAHITLYFVIGYNIAAMIQVAALLLFAYFIVGFIWRCHLDPDDVAIPFVTSMGDLIGTASLSICFIVLSGLVPPSELGVE